MAAGTRRPTLADVAARSGMSKAAVSMVLNNRPGSRLSAEAARKVHAAADELGYRPNPAAQSLRLGKTRTIGFISDQVTVTRFASEMIRGLLAAAKARGHSVLIAETEGDAQAFAEAVTGMLDRRVDGLLIGLMAARQIEVPPLNEVPAVIVNGSSTAGHPQILPDEFTAGEAMARALVGAGHSQIAVIGNNPHVRNSPQESVTIDHRFEGIAEGLRQADIEPIMVEVPGWIPTVGYDYTHRLLDDHPEVTAILAANDGVAFGCYQALAERGLRIPGDISVASFDDEELAGYQRPGLTTARLPYDVMGELGVQMLLDETDPESRLVPMPVIARGSIGAPRQGR